MTTRYLLDGQSVIAELQDANSNGRFTDEEDPEHPPEVNNGVSEMTALYCPGPRGIEFRVDGEGTRRWYLYDGLGSVLAEVTDAGAITAARKYDVYGALRDSSGEDGGSQKFVGSLGHATEPSTGGLIYMRARWYDPAVGRFVSEDPARHGGNWYAYCGANPISRIDRSGRFWEDPEIEEDLLAGSEYSKINEGAEALNAITEAAENAMSQGFDEHGAMRFAESVMDQFGSTPTQLEAREVFRMAMRKLASGAFNLSRGSGNPLIAVLFRNLQMYVILNDAEDQIHTAFFP